MLVHHRVTPQTLNLPVSIYTPEWILRQCESKVSRPRTQHNVPAGLELGALALEPSTLTKRPQCFRKKCNVLPIFCYKGSSIGRQIPGSPEIFFQKTSSQGRSQSKSQPEPGNIRDKNALKFEAFLGGEWYILGYCALAKNPKLKKALQNEEITNITIFNLRRNRIHQVKDFRFSGGVNIVKKEIWEKDDTRKTYNSNLC